MGTPSGSHHILALRLPGNVERIVNDLRSEFYRLTPATSTQALPPILPLAYLAEDTGSDSVSPLPQTEIVPLQIGGIGRSGDAGHETLVLEVAMADSWSEWLRGFATIPAPRGMPVPLAGLFLGGSDLVDYWSGSSQSAELEFIRSLSDKLRMRLSVLHVELVSLQIPASGAWWDHLDWEILWSKRIKLRGQTVTI